MVLEEGRKNGVGVWELDGYDTIVEQVHAVCDLFIAEQDFVDNEAVSIEEVVVVGSFGDGMGVQGQSDLDLVVFTSFMGDNRSNNYSQFMQHLAGKLKMREDDILSSVVGVSELDTYVIPFFERSGFFHDLASNGIVEQYYSLSLDEKQSYY